MNLYVVEYAADGVNFLPCFGMGGQAMAYAYYDDAENMAQALTEKEMKYHNDYTGNIVFQYRVKEYTNEV